MQQKTNVLLRFLPLVGLILFIWIVHKTGFQNILDAFRNFDFRWILPVPFLVAFFTYTKAQKWQWILRAYGIEYPLMKCAKAMLVGFFASLITPGKVGDGMRVAYLRRDTQTPISTGLSTLFLDRLADLLAVLVLAGVSMVILANYFHFRELIPLVVTSGMILIAAVAIGTNEKLIRKILRPFFHWWVPERYHERCRNMFQSFYGTMTGAKKHKGLILKAFLINILSWSVTIADYYLFAHALGIPLTVAHLFAIAPLTVFIEVLPLSVSGVGTRDATLLFFFTQLGLPIHLAVPYSLTLLVFGAWIYGILGLVIWFKNPISFQRPADATPTS